MLIYDNHLYKIKSSDFSNKIVVFDRDDTIISDPLNNKEKNALIWNKGALNLMSKIQNTHKCWLAIISNQARIHDRSQSIRDLEFITQQIFLETFKNKIFLSYVLYCPHSREQTTRCGCRKPDVGMLEFLRNRIDIPLNNFIFVGNAESDKQAAFNFNIKFIRYNNEFSTIGNRIDSFFSGMSSL